MWKGGIFLLENIRLKEKIMETLASVLPLTAIVFILSITLLPLSSGALVLFLFGAVMLIIGREDVNEAIQDVEWTTILFFMSLFVVVGGLTETGIIKELASKIIDATNGHPMVTMLVLLWASALLSSILDNIPFVATLIPLILAMQADGIDVTSFWWAISLGACLGGNGTMIGASANVVLSDISTKHGYPITFKSYLKVGMPFMLLSIVISTVFLVVKFDIM